MRELDQALRERDALKAALEAERGIVRDERKRSDALKAALAVLEDSSLKLRADNDRLQRDNDRLQRKHAGLQGLFDGARESERQARAEIERLRAEVAESEALRSRSNVENWVRVQQAHLTELYEAAEAVCKAASVVELASKVRALAAVLAKVTP